MNNKETKVFMVGCTEEELANKIAEIVVSLIKPLLPEKEDKLLTRKEASKKLNISPQTLVSKVNDGVIQEIRVGKKVLYRESDLDKALLVIRKYKRFDLNREAA